MHISQMPIISKTTIFTTIFPFPNCEKAQICNEDLENVNEDNIWQCVVVKRRKICTDKQTTGDSETLTKMYSALTYLDNNNL